MQEISLSVNSQENFVPFTLEDVVYLVDGGTLCSQRTNFVNELVAFINSIVGVHLATCMFYNFSTRKWSAMVQPLPLNNMCFLQKNCFNVSKCDVGTSWSLWHVLTTFRRVLRITRTQRFILTASLTRTRTLMLRAVKHSIPC